MRDFSISGGAMRNAIFLAVLFLMSVVVSPANAECIKCGDTCPELGVTTLDKNKDGTELAKPEAIIVCLKEKPAHKEKDCNGGITCRWKQINNESKSIGYNISQADLAKFHKYCTNDERFFITCSSACSRFCRDSCNPELGKQASEVVNCTPVASNAGKIYKGGVFMDWISSTEGRCVCYD